ncbi:O-6-methylguanine DNA methyltransferase [Caulobacter sp. AP07]|uniref:methylated-DNA--[protein]-cysteine S-methyltransferase n=1 Tax=Caulobacter sp. AP07 TaxID=1144304 RepID=UPI000272068D|nr:methylated-DNA--[protein]-cysteine S-methyltransferase [Caulobacter sp. AP07]EJL34705.1 O-6-methylguanine DNA methyltransferase [Caulobacter sp. AP07]
MEQGFALFETPIGLCGLAWGPQGLVGAQLPEAAPGAAWARLRRRYPDAAEAPPPPSIQRAIERINDLLAGGRDDLTDIVLDFSIVAPFNRRVYEIARAIPPGETSTYGQIAKAMGEPGAARAIGKALGENPWPIIVPCHRVLGADGKPGGFSAPGGVETKARMLTIERAKTSAVPTLFDMDFSVAPARGR